MNNNPPFAPRQKIIRIGPSNDAVKKGGIYECIRCTQCACGYWFVQIKLPSDPHKLKKCTCKDCHKQINAPTDYLGGNAKFFAPIITNYSDATAEILEKFKSPNETPDKILTPEKVEQ